MSIREDLLYMLLPSGSSEGAGWGKYPDTWLECPVPSGNAINILIADNVPYNTGEKKSTVMLHIARIDSSADFTAVVDWGDGTSDTFYSNDGSGGYREEVEHTYTAGTGHTFYEGCEQWLISVVIEGNGAVWELNNCYAQAVCSGSEYNYSNRNISSWEGSNGCYTTIQYVNAQGAVVPKYFVTAIDAIHYLDMPNVLDIPKYCAFNCKGLIAINAPKAQSIADDAIAYDYGLQYVTVSAQCDVSSVALSNCYSFVNFIREE